MSMSTLLVGNPVGEPKVFNAQDENKQTVVLVTLAMDRDYQEKDGTYGVDYVQLRAFPRSDKHGSFIWNTITNALEKKRKVAVKATRQQNVYVKDGETVYEDINRIDDINLTGSANSVQAVGRLSRDAQFFKDVAIVTLAVERDYIAKGDKQPKVDHLQAKLFLRSDKQTETMKKHLLKGALVEITGAIRSSKYTNKENVEVFSEDVIIDHINPFLAGKPGKASATQEAPAKEEASATASNANPFL